MRVPGLNHRGRCGLAVTDRAPRRRAWRSEAPRRRAGERRMRPPSATSRVGAPAASNRRGRGQRPHEGGRRHARSRSPVAVAVRTAMPAPGTSASPAILTHRDRCGADVRGDGRGRRTGCPGVRPATALDAARRPSESVAPTSSSMPVEQPGQRSSTPVAAPTRSGLRNARDGRPPPAVDLLSCRNSACPRAAVYDSDLPTYVRRRPSRRPPPRTASRR